VIYDGPEMQSREKLRRYSPRAYGMGGGSCPSLPQR
jgi:hypothetical protein